MIYIFRYQLSCVTTFQPDWSKLNKTINIPPSVVSAKNEIIQI